MTYSDLFFCTLNPILLNMINNERDAIKFVNYLVKFWFLSHWTQYGLTWLRMREIWFIFVWLLFLQNQHYNIIELMRKAGHGEWERFDLYLCGFCFCRINPYNILALMQKEEIGRACESFKLSSLVSQGCKGQNLHLAGITTGKIISRYKFT